MRHFRHIIAMAVAALCFCGARAGEVTSEMAMAAADAWMAANPSFGATGSAVSAVAEYDGGTLLWWTVATSNGGAIFVSPDTSIEPVLAAVPKCSGALPAEHPLRAILKADIANRRAVIAAATETPASRPMRLMSAAASFSSTSSGTITNEAVAAAVAVAEGRWTKYTTPRTRIRLMASASEPTTNVTVLAGFGDESDNMYMRFWNQSVLNWPMNSMFGVETCFNLYTPSNAVCGCVATAGAAILQYFGCSGLVQNVMRECSYNGEKVSLTTISATNRYDWSMLPQSMGGQDSRSLSAFSDEEMEAVVSLLGRATYDMGVCVNMAYTSDESGANTADIAKALVQDFGFHNAKDVTFSPGTNGLEVAKAITNDICRLKRPVALGIRGSGGHAVLGVGYGEDEEGMQYTRLFMGWGGYGDAWYNLPEIKVATGVGYHVFNLVQKAVTSIALNPPIGYHTIAEVKAAALESKKPILLISGTEGQPTTDDLIAYINDAGYADKFEIFYADYGTDGGYADQNPSYGVFSPITFNKDDIDNRWAFFNGRLSYFTNETEVAASPAEVDAVLNEGLEKWEEEYAQYLHDVAAEADGISLTVCQGSYYLDEEVGAYLPDELGLVDNYDNIYTNGETVVMFAPCEFATNTTGEVAWKCIGWELYKKNGKLVEDGDGTNATFAVSAGTAYELCWIWEPDAVKATITPKGNGSVTPDASNGVWMEYGTTNTFVAVPANDGVSQFDSWNGDAYGRVAGSAVDILAISPCNIRAYFKQNSAAQSYTLTISNECYATYYDFDPIEPPPTPTFTPMFGDRPLENGDNTLLEGPMAVSVPEKWTDSTGGVWKCVGWVGTNSVPEYGSASTAGFNLTTNSVITWYWIASQPDAPEPVIEPAEVPIGPVEGGVTNSAIVIYSTNNVQMAVETRISNAVAGYWYSIWSADTVDGQYSYVSGTYTGEAKRKVEKPVPEILSLVIVFDPVDAAKFYRVVVTEDEPK